ncbi:aspartate--tRNA(Asn) ligase [Haloimpatiens massiliensis]|uniref:aspartate--tRNA(Asn) ligase n=1 Tax=Haloimpatiens massiliensis TaxID=1658110 RepID=UPI000C828F5E|nr:aspartate--tRNA(Asn) ligase [Haloimpatiens massiliensis]
MQRILIKNLSNQVNSQVSIKGWVYKIRKLSKVSFLIIRDRTGLVQCVLDSSIKLNHVKLESVVEIVGNVVESKNKISNIEIQVSSLNIISKVEDELPLEVNKEDVNANLDTLLDHRVLSLRQQKINSIFKIQGVIAQGFREFLLNEDFTEIFTPKIVSEGAEGGTAIFKVKYFEREAFLAQSPQFYKQMMVGAGYERVFEIAHVYRAEEHNTSRHLNEYISMDLEMGFIENERDVMDIETNILKHILYKLKNECGKLLEFLEIQLPQISEKIPSITFSEAINLLKTEYGKECNEGDLDPEGEKLICKYAEEKMGSEFLFITDYPRKKRPMYTMPKGEKFTYSFDLLFRGLEITTGGQRIHDYSMLAENMIYKGLNPENFTTYMEVFKYGMPPHGGLAIGLERLTSQILGLKNVREASLFPRDRTRLLP